MKTASPENELKIAPDKIKLALRAYAKLHDGLSDMIESGRLTEADIPDDYQWLVGSLVKLSAYWNYSGNAAALHTPELDELNRHIEATENDPDNLAADC